MNDGAVEALTGILRGSEGTPTVVTFERLTVAGVRLAAEKDRPPAVAHLLHGRSHLARVEGIDSVVGIRAGEQHRGQHRLSPS
jgi:hypothetical protein